MYIERLRVMSLFLGLSFAIGAHANSAPAESPYVGMQDRPIKALSTQEINELESGHGMGLSLVAELNHYPGPRHVLDWADQLALSPTQQSRVGAVYDAMARDARRLGKRIIADEAALERLFTAHSAVDPNKVRALTLQIAKLRGELRFVHLRAHLATKELLTPKQASIYDQLRGYASDGDSASHHHHHHPGKGD